MIFPPACAVHGCAARPVLHGAIYAYQALSSHMPDVPFTDLAKVPASTVMVPGRHEYPANRRAGRYLGYPNMVVPQTRPTQLAQLGLPLPLQYPISYLRPELKLT